MRDEIKLDRRFVSLELREIFRKKKKLHDEPRDWNKYIRNNPYI